MDGEEKNGRDRPTTREVIERCEALPHFSELPSVKKTLRSKKLSVKESVLDRYEYVLAEVAFVLNCLKIDPGIEGFLSECEHSDLFQLQNFQDQIERALVKLRPDIESYRESARQPGARRRAARPEHQATPAMPPVVVNPHQEINLTVIVEAPPPNVPGAATAGDIPEEQGEPSGGADIGKEKKGDGPGPCESADFVERLEALNTILGADKMFEVTSWPKAHEAIQQLNDPPKWIEQISTDALRICIQDGIKNLKKWASWPDEYRGFKRTGGLISEVWKENQKNQKKD